MAKAGFAEAVLAPSPRLKALTNEKIFFHFSLREERDDNGII